MFNHQNKSSWVNHMYQHLDSETCWQHVIVWLLNGALLSLKKILII